MARNKATATAATAGAATAANTFDTLGVVVPTPTPISGSVLHYRRAHPGGGPLGRCSYGVPGVAGIVVFDVALFLPGAPPATLTLAGVTLATPTPRNVAGVTSAVVAGANGAAAVAAGTPIATPAAVAAVAGAVGAAVVGAALAGTTANRGGKLVA